MTKSSSTDHANKYLQIIQMTISDLMFDLLDMMINWWIILSPGVERLGKLSNCIVIRKTINLTQGSLPSAPILLESAKYVFYFQRKCMYLCCIFYIMHVIQVQLQPYSYDKVVSFKWQDMDTSYNTVKVPAY